MASRPKRRKSKSPTTGPASHPQIGTPGLKDLVTECMTTAIPIIESTITECFTRLNSNQVSATTSTVPQKQESTNTNSDPVAGNIIAFHANLKSHLNNVAVDTVICFEDVLLNQGGGYNPQTGIFTAPDDGLYSFTWAFLTKKGGTIYLSAVVDNETKVRSCVKNLQEDYISTSGHLLYELKKGSQVWIQTYYLIATYIHANCYTYFSGHRIN